MIPKRLKVDVSLLKYLKDEKDILEAKLKAKQKKIKLNKLSKKVNELIMRADAILNALKK